MLFIDNNDIHPENTSGIRKDRKVICEICSTMGEKYHIEKVTMKFDAQANVYSCPRCLQKVSGKVIENDIYFNNKDFIHEPAKLEKEQGNIIEFGGLNENDEMPEFEFANLDSESEDPQSAF